MSDGSLESDSNVYPFVHNVAQSTRPSHTPLVERAMDAIIKATSISNAIVEECSVFLERNKLGPKIGREHRLPLGIVVNLISHLLEVFKGHDRELLASNQAGTKRRIRAELSCVDVSTEGVDALDNNNVHVEAIPSLIRSFLDLSLTHFSSGHWENTLRAVVPDTYQRVQRVQGRPQRAIASSGRELVPLGADESVHGLV